MKASLKSQQCQYTTTIYIIIIIYYYLIQTLTAQGFAAELRLHYYRLFSDLSPALIQITGL